MLIVATVVVLALLTISFVTYYELSAPSDSTSTNSSVASYTESSSCIGPGTTTTELNMTSITTISTCSITQVVLDAGGCYNFASGASICVEHAPPGSVARLYGNGTIITTYPDGQVVSCDIAHAQGPCVEGVP